MTLKLKRAAEAIALTLAEGAGRFSRKDQARFFQIAFGSLRECQAILDLASITTSQALENADVLAANIYRLIESRRRG